MASDYEDATEDIQSLVASTLDVATKQDRAFVAGASQALAKWTTTYQQAMSQGENRSIPDQLARWDRVWEARIALSRQVTSLTTEHKQSTVSGEIFRTLLPACFEQVRIRTEATFSELNANLPSLLCRFVTPDQGGQSQVNDEKNEDDNADRDADRALRDVEDKLLGDSLNDSMEIM